MRLWIGRLLVTLLVVVCAVPASARGLDGINLLPGPILTNPVPQLDPKPIPVAFSAIANRYSGVDASTVFDLDGDLVGDIKISATQVTAQGGAKVQLVQPAQLNLDQVQLVPATGYSTSASLQLNRVYVAQLSSGYAKFMVLQSSPKVTIWFHFGVPTTSVLKADGTGSHAVLTWDALPDAALGYNIYRYDVGDSNSYTVTQLNDFTVQATTFTDDTAANKYYIYAVQAVKAGGSPGSLTTVAAVNVQYKQRSLVIKPNTTAATLDGANLTLAAQPVIKNGLLMVPASALTNAGAKVTVSGSSVTISRRIDDVTYTVVITVDSTDYTWNSTAYKFDVAPYKAGNEVMVPLRTMAPILGVGVTFNSTDRTATVQWAE